MSATTAASSSSNSANTHAADRCLRFGWWMLVASLALGFGLEVLHGFKLGWYLDVGNDTRRLMFTLAHAHGALLGLVNIAAALTVRVVRGCLLTRTTANFLIGAAVILPLGFLLGGIVTHDGDPGLGIMLAPIGAVLLLFGVAGFARAVSRSTRSPRR